MATGADANAAVAEVNAAADADVAVPVVHAGQEALACVEPADGATILRIVAWRSQKMKRNVQLDGGRACDGGERTTNGSLVTNLSIS